MNRSMPGLPVHHQLPEVTQTHIHRVSDTIQPSHPLSSPSLPAPNPSQHLTEIEKSNTFVLVRFSAQNQISQKKSYVFKPVEFLFHHDSLIPGMSCLAWKRSRCHSNKTSVSLNLHLHSSFLSHAEHTQPLGPDSRSHCL